MLGGSNFMALHGQTDRLLCQVKDAAQSVFDLCAKKWHRPIPDFVDKSM
jgi:hypothetical protein